jgi:hypothetical protein
MLDVLLMMGQGTVKEDVKVVNVEVPEIRIKGLCFKDQKLSLSIENIFLEKTGKEKDGRIGIHIRILDHFNMLFAQKKLLSTHKDIVYVDIPMSKLIKGMGTPEIAVEVKDLHTGKTDRKSILLRCQDHTIIRK